MILYGRWGSFKSMLGGIDLGFKAAFGKDWLGLPTAGFSTYYLQIEVTEYMMQQRVIKYMEGNNLLPTQRFRINTAPWYKIGGDNKNELGIELQYWKPDVLVIDPIYKVLRGDISSAVDVQRFLDEIDLIKEKYKVAVILIGHIRKPPNDETGNPVTNASMQHDLMGSSFYGDWADTMISMNITDEEADYSSISINFEKHRHSQILIPPRELIVNRNSLQLTTHLANV